MAGGVARSEGGPGGLARACARAARGSAGAGGGLLPGRSPGGRRAERFRRGGARPRGGDLLSPAGRRRGASRPFLRPLCPRGHGRRGSYRSRPPGGAAGGGGRGLPRLVRATPCRHHPAPGRRRLDAGGGHRPLPPGARRGGLHGGPAGRCSNWWRIARFRGYASVSSWCCATSAGTSASGPACCRRPETASPPEAVDAAYDAVEVWGEAVPQHLREHVLYLHHRRLRAAGLAGRHSTSLSNSGPPRTPRATPTS